MNRRDELRGRQSEQASLAALLDGARSGASQVLVVRGEAGIGKSALLDQLAEGADGFTVARSAGVESEMELAYAGLQQLCAPFLDRLDRLPEPQQEALRVAFGMSGGEVPNRFLIGLAVLHLFADLAEDGPVLCVVDDAQWLDRMSTLIVSFVARRLLAERIVFVISVREPTEVTEFDGLGELLVGGLGETDAAALLDSVVSGPLDPRVRERIIAETRGNPLALLELPRAWTTAEVMDGFELGTVPLAGRIEQGFIKRLDELTPDARMFLLTAAAEPLGDPGVLWRAAGKLGLGADPASAAERAGLIELGTHVRFRHPLVRAAAYRSATSEERQAVHRALAEATDAEVDPDRRAWHHAQATTTPDEEIAAEIERSAGRAKARGGNTAAAALLEHAARLSPDPGKRADRQLAAAWAKLDAGAIDAALGMLAAVEAGPFESLRHAQVQHLRGQAAFDQRRSYEAAQLLRGAAKRLAFSDVGLARETHLDAVTAAVWASGGANPEVVAEVAEGCHLLPPPQEPLRPVDAVLEALTTRLTVGYLDAVPQFGQALQIINDIEDGADVGRLLSMGGNRISAILATELWNFQAGRELAERQVKLARDTGALIQLQFGLNVLAANRLLAGDFADAAALIEEDRTIGEVTGYRAVGYASVLLAALRAQPDAQETIGSARHEAWDAGQGRLVTFADYASAVLNNALGQHEVARDAALRVFKADVVGGYQIMAVSELGEAASRTGDTELLERAHARMEERSKAIDSDWARGVEARLRAFLSSGDDADAAYRESAKYLKNAGVRVEAARGRLLYGEWLRREGQRVEARDQLRAAHEKFSDYGLAAFAERAARELSATGEKARKRNVETTEELTPQEFQIARLAQAGYSNPEIGTRLFLSPRTVEWHLGKVFQKLGVSSRRQLRDTVIEAVSA